MRPRSGIQSVSARTAALHPDETACSLVDGCLVCGDVAVPVTVVEADESDAVCEDPHGQRGTVGVELVTPVAPGDRLLVHGGVAIARIAEVS